MKRDFKAVMRWPISALTILVFLGSLALFSASCETQKEETERLEQRAYRIVNEMVFVRNPDVKGICFGVVPSGWEPGLVTIECAYVEHLLVNPTPSSLPPMENME